jgi:hypothetical protein
MLQNITQALRKVPGVVAVVLGGSRATETSTPNSDYDVGIYYDQGSFDLTTLQVIATRLDDKHRSDLIAGPGGWGEWVNGGGWLTVEGHAVDIILRDVARVNSACADAVSGRVTCHYQPGHPHAFLNIMYAGELASSRVLWSGDLGFDLLKQQMERYPSALKQALVHVFSFEAEFSLSLAQKYAGTSDAYYVTAHLVRAVSAVNQWLYAVNERYCLNEKRAVHNIEHMPIHPPDYGRRIETVFGGNPPEERCTLLQGIIEEVKQIPLT